MTLPQRLQQLGTFLGSCREIAHSEAVTRWGRLTHINGLVLEASGLALMPGSACHIHAAKNEVRDAEVVGFADNRSLLISNDPLAGMTPGSLVSARAQPSVPPRVGVQPTHRRRAVDQSIHVQVGHALLGRVVDGIGRPLDGAPAPVSGPSRPLYSRPLNPLSRQPIRQILDVGVRSINAMFTIGRGQRLGLFAGSGIGKSMLLGMLARHCQADFIVVALVGERGREVGEFFHHTLDGSSRARSVLVATPSDHSPLMRLQGAAYATAIAEHFRDEGAHVLLLVDSLTRYAMAQREVALAIGEPPVTKGYPPSVFTRLPQLVERAGNGAHGGSITAIYTVLTEGDDLQDPIADAARAILDGHLVLSRTLADQGHYPAIDLEHSISRVMDSLITPHHSNLVRRFHGLYVRYQRHRDLLAIGAYSRGQDPELDEALARHGSMMRFLQQPLAQGVSFDSALEELQVFFSSAQGPELLQMPQDRQQMADDALHGT